MQPHVSIIVPTHNRCALIERLLTAFSAQSRLRDDLEIIIVADDCHDDTVPKLLMCTDLPLKVVECPGLGPAGARNAGAEAARGNLLIFLDDDILPGPNWLAAHEAAHVLYPDSVIIGAYRPVPIPHKQLFRRVVQRWWDDHFDALETPGHRIRYTDILTGNISIPAKIWRKLGGLDERLRAHEDYDLGLRLLSLNIPIIVMPDAAGRHYEYETMQIHGALSRARQEGQADVILAEKHPSIRCDLQLVAWRRWSSRGSNIKDHFIFAQGRHLERVARWAERRLPALERWTLLPHHRALLGYLQTFWYIRGVADQFDTFKDWQRFALQPDPEPIGQILSIDIQSGLSSAEAELDAIRPAGVELRYGAHVIGHLPRTPGTEPWAGRHLRGQIFSVCGPAYLRELASDAMVSDGSAEVLEQFGATLKRLNANFSYQSPPETFWEQDEQWRRFFTEAQDRAVYTQSQPVPRISFIVPAWNAAATVGQTLESLSMQSFSDWEAVVIDDGSTDDTIAVVGAICRYDRRIRLLRTDENNGPSAARNAGLAAAQGEWVTFLDSDDWLAPEFAERMLALADTSNADAVYCGYRKVTLDGTLAIDYFDEEIAKNSFYAFSRRCGTAIHSIIAKRDTLLEQDGFDTSLRLCEDWDLWQRLARRGSRFIGLPETLAFYRLGHNNITTDYRGMLADGLRVMRRGHDSDPRVTDPDPEYVNGTPHDLLHVCETFYALWCAAAQIGAGGTSDGFMESVSTPLHVIEAESDLMVMLAEALATGARLPLSDIAANLSRFNVELDRLIEILAAQQPRGGLVNDLQYRFERVVLCALPNGREALLRRMAHICIRPGLPRSITLPDSVDRVRVEIIDDYKRLGIFEVPSFGGFNGGDLVLIAARLMSPEQLDRFFAGAPADPESAHTGRHIAAVLKTAAAVDLDQNSAGGSTQEPDLQADLTQSQERWEEVFSKTDPWRYGSSYEQRKYQRTIDLLPEGGISRALELACAEGHFTMKLAEHVDTLVAVDISARAIDRAAKRCEELKNVRLQQLDVVVDALPGSQDLIICSEFLYYLDGLDELLRVVGLIRDALVPGGAIVMANHFLLRDDKGATGFDWDQAYGGKVIHEAFKSTQGLALEESLVTDLYRVDRFCRIEPGDTPPPPVIRHEALSSVLEPHVARFVVWGGATARRREVEDERTWHVPVLMYHRVADDGLPELSRWRVSQDTFRAHLRLLRQHGFRSTTSEEILRHRMAKEPLRGRPVLLTFDDGYCDFATAAWPLLQENDFCAEVFLVTDRVGEESVWDAAAGSTVPLMDWGTIQRLGAEGVYFGSHLATHTPAPSLSSEALLQEAARSRHAIGVHTGQSVVSVAAPYGAVDTRLGDILADVGYGICFSCNWGRADIRADAMAMPRMEVWGAATDSDLARILDLANSNLANAKEKMANAPGAKEA